MEAYTTITFDKQDIYDMLTTFIEGGGQPGWEIEQYSRENDGSIYSNYVTRIYFADGTMVSVHNKNLSGSAEILLNKFGHTDAARQLRRSIVAGDLDLDVDAVSVLLQIHLLAGEIKYG